MSRGSSSERLSDVPRAQQLVPDHLESLPSCPSLLLLLTERCLTCRCLMASATIVLHAEEASPGQRWQTLSMGHPLSLGPLATSTKGHGTFPATLAQALQSCRHSTPQQLPSIEDAQSKPTCFFGTRPHGILYLTGIFFSLNGSTLSLLCALG